MQKAPVRESFQLSEMKSKERASIEFKAKTSFSDGEATYSISLNDHYPIIPHPDLFEQLDKLKIRLADFYGYTLFVSLVNSKDFVGSKAQKKYSEQFLEQQLEKIKVNGVSYSGKRNGLRVKGTYNGSSINTKILYFVNTEYGEELEEIANRLEDEMYEYLFKGKKAQLEAFD